MNKKTSFATHVLVLGWFHVVASAIFVVLACLGFVFFAGIGAASGDPEAMPILTLFGCLGFVLFGVFAVPGLIAGWGLLARKPWGRVMGIVVAIIDMFNIPIGTAFGIYGLWVLTEPEAETYFTERPLPPGE